MIVMLPAVLTTDNYVGHMKTLYSIVTVLL